MMTKRTLSDRTGGIIKIRLCFIFAALVLGVMSARPVPAADFELARKSLSDLRGVCVVVEQVQPSLQKYSKKAQLSAEDLQKRVELQLKESGIKVYNREQWLDTPGKPILYVNVNTHEYQKYQFAYDVRVELDQVVSLEANPQMRIIATTWSANMTGAVNTGSLGVIPDRVKEVVGLFIKAYLAAHK